MMIKDAVIDKKSEHHKNSRNTAYLTGSDKNTLK